MIKKLIYIIIISVNLIALTVKSEDIEQKKLFVIRPFELIEAKKMSFLVPIMVYYDENHNEKSETCVDIKIPKDFKLYSSSKYHAEYISIKDNNDIDASETIAVFSFNCDNLQESLSKFKHDIINNLKNVKVIDQSIKSVDDYQVATTVFSRDFNSKKQLSVDKYYHGKLSCIQIHYSIILDGNMTETQALKKIKKFINDPAYVAVLKIKR